MKWQDLDAKARRKAVVFAAVVGVAVAVLLWPTGASRATARPHPARTQPRHGNGEPVPHIAASAPGQSAQDAGVLGKWEGDGAALANHRVCRLWLEIAKKTEEPGKYTGAATLSCTPALGLEQPKPDTAQAMLLARLNPLAATMTGAWDKDSLAFRLDKQLNAGDCAWTRFSVSRFGSQNISAGIEDACGGGSVLLRRSQ